MRPINSIHVVSLVLGIAGGAACDSGRSDLTGVGGSLSNAGGAPVGGSVGGSNSTGGTTSGGSVSGGHSSGGTVPDAAGGQRAVETFPVTLNFAAKVFDEEFACGKTYTKQGSAETEVTPGFLRFYVSNVRLITKSGQEVPATLAEVSPWQGGGVALLDFEDGTGSCSQGNAELRTKIEVLAPKGDYAGVAFSTAVPEELNHEDPTTLPAPLQASVMMWGWGLGYKFLVAELVEPFGTEDNPGGEAQFHLGSAGCVVAPSASGGSAPVEGDIECIANNYNDIRLETFDSSTDTIVMDVGAVFKDVDLSTTF